MGIFILLGCLVIFGFFMAYFGDYYEVFLLECIGRVAGIISSFILVILLCFLPTLQSDFDYTKEKYYNLKSQVEYVESDMIFNDANLRNQVLEMNNKIASHKVYSKNWWIGKFYSEEIGNLPRLQWKSEQVFK